MKKWLGMTGLILCLCFTGCGSENEKEQSDKETGREEIVLWSYYETDMQKTSLDELVNGFNESQEQYYLSWEYHGPATELSLRHI